MKLGTVALGAIAAGARARLERCAAGLAAFALPQRCPGCGALADPARFLCDACRARVPRLAIPLCVRCLAYGREPVGCLGHPGFQTWPAWIYDERTAVLLQALKFGERTGLADTLAAELERVVPPGGFDALLAVPLHRARRRERGYNQAALLAAALARRIGVPVLEAVLERTRATAPQTRLGPAERRRNLRAAFRVATPGWIEGRRVLLVDDVMTTGATLEAALAVLGDGGARAAAVTVAWAQ